MRPDGESAFQGGAQNTLQDGPQDGPIKGPDLEVELISAHTRITGTVNLGTYMRLSDLLNFLDPVLTVTSGALLDTTGAKTADGAPELDVWLSNLTVVMDHSTYVPPPDSLSVEKKSYQMIAVTEAHVINATFFIYPGAEPITYLRAREPRWIAVTDVVVRSVSDRSMEAKAKFAILNRESVVASSVV
jgi:hypothetical protein